MTAIKQDLYVEQGATFYYTFQILTSTLVDGVPTPGGPADLTGCTFRTEVRKVQHAAPLVSITNAASSPPSGSASGFLCGLDETQADNDTPDLTNGWVRLRISDDDTDLFIHKTSLYDIEMEEPSGRVRRLYQGKVTTDPNITQVVPDDPIVED